MDLIVSDETGSRIVVLRWGDINTIIFSRDREVSGEGWYSSGVVKAIYFYLSYISKLTAL